MTISVVVADERVISMCASTNSREEVPMLCDSEANVHMTPWKKDIRGTCTVNRSYTLRNKGELQALAMGEISLHMSGRSKEAPVKVTLKDILGVSGLPCRMLSTRIIRPDGGEVAESGRKES